MDERRDEEVGVEGEERSEERGVREGSRELGEGVGDVDGGGARGGEEVGEAEQANGASLSSSEVERRSVALGARAWRRR